MMKYQRTVFGLTTSPQLTLLYADMINTPIDKEAFLIHPLIQSELKQVTAVKKHAKNYQITYTNYTCRIHNIIFVPNYY